ncbi:hypothetical protein [Tumebacillus flagellatus]|uniref:hypothetical protein n=1 Tax=Tumebacillus flagellatus TaxID=1157490 RepID=UPI001376EDDF|nr:hypothetical protein [Tumebacillus flagellatus]
MGKIVEQEKTKPKQQRKKREHRADDSNVERNADFQKQGMTHSWQGFYAQVRITVRE